METPTGVLLGEFTPGLCRCGCGQRTRVATKTHTRLGHVKGQPLSYIHGHRQRVYRKPIDRTADRLRLLANVASGPADACWEWTGGRTEQGYGKYFIDGRTVGAHRWAFIFAKGPIPDGQMVRHTCDNPPCCNPQHLLIGTHRQNVDDAIARDRTTRGTRNGRARLGPEQVRQIRARAADGETGTALAAAFGVHHNTIYRLLDGRTWGWLPQKESS